MINNPQNNDGFLKPNNNKIPAKLKQISKLNKNMFKLVFSLPSQDKCLGHNIGQYVSIIIGDSMRNYVPVSRVNQLGIVEFVIRDMRKQNGIASFTNLLINLKQNQQVTICGPYNQFYYLGNGKFKLTLLKIQKTFKNIGLIAFQSGVTAFQGLINNVMEEESISINLLWVGQQVDDFYIQNDLQKLSTKASRCRVSFMLEKEQQNWPYLSGEIREEHLLKTMPEKEDSVILLAGPPDEVNHCVSLLKKLGYQYIIEPEQCQAINQV